MELATPEAETWQIVMLCRGGCIAKIVLFTSIHFGMMVFEMGPVRAEIVPMDASTLPAVQHFLAERGLSASGLRGLAVTSAPCREALRPGGRPTILVGFKDGDRLGSTLRSQIGIASGCGL